ncbi:O-antigen ligase family protein [Cellvibrio sp. QJXJ]|uniref:O-antigen ligase family protein n=1 Tax=Cellvibrio sp. QJXJ TaxID=2964606 RepID=UPI0021C3A502|nr:O-antigen ligase family protein [Cellvibrio sp. QJXJ]UUA71395.1 O-antigen ligase family protein [Cellvibrio sp. QJXJ]
MNHFVGVHGGASASKKIVIVSGFTFFLFIIYQLFFFLNIPSRIPGLGIVRPTVLLFLILAVLLIAQRDKIAHKFNQPIFKVFSAFLIVLIVTLPFVTYPGSVLRTNLQIFIKAIVFLYFCALILDTEKRLKISLFIFVACQVFRVLEPLFLNITTGYWGSSTYMGSGEFANRLSGAPADVINPNELGFVIVTAIPFLHYFLLQRGWIIKLFYLGLLAILLYALILTMSRGAFLALIVVGWFVFKESKRKFMLIVFIVIGIIAALSVMNDVQRDRYLSLFSSESKQSASAEGRINGMIKEFELGLKRPIFGFGLGTTAEAKYNTFGRRQASHTMYGELLIEVGIVGMYFFMRFIIAIRRQLKEGIVSAETCSDFYKTLFKICNVVFWMFVVYSINYWGLSQYYWYNLAGIVIAASILMNMNKIKESNA